MSDTEHRSFKILKFVLRLLCAVVIIGVLIWKSREQLNSCLHAFDYKLVLPAILFYAAHHAVCAWRWQRLAALQNFEISFYEALSLTLQGAFFSLILPGGAIGGDVVKMGMLAKRQKKGSRVEGMFTIFMDRVIGMVSLFGLSIVLLLLFMDKLPSLRIPGVNISLFQLKMIVGIILALCVAGIAAGVGIFFHRSFEKVPFIRAMMQFADRRFNNAVSRMTSAADLYAKSPWQLIFLTLISVCFVHLMIVVPMIFLLSGTDLPLNGANLLLIATAVTLGNIAGLIPLAPGGIGLRDLTVIAVFSSGGIAAGNGETAQLLMTGVMIFVSLLGGIFFILDPGTKSISTDRNEP